LTDAAVAIGPPSGRSRSDRIWRRIVHRTHLVEARLPVEVALIACWLVARLTQNADLTTGLLIAGSLVALRWPGSGMSIAALAFLFPSTEAGIMEGTVLTAAGAIGCLAVATRSGSRLWVGPVMTFAAALALTTGLALVRLATGPLAELAGVAALRWVGAMAGLAVLPILVFLIGRGARRCVVVIALGTAAAIVLGILDGVLPGSLEQTIVGPLLSTVAFDRANGPFPSPNRLGTVAAMAAVAMAAVAWDRRGWFQVILAAAASLSAGTVLVSYSRGALVGLAVAAFLLVARRSLRLALGLAVVVVVMVVLVGPAFMDSRLGGNPPPARSDEQAANDAGRWDAWLAGLRMAYEAPLTGQGYGSFAALSTDFGGPSDLATAHNETIGLLAGAGLPAGISYLGLIGACVWTFRRRSTVHEVGLAAVVAFAVATSFNIQSVYPQVTVPLWTMVAVGLALGATGPDQVRDAESSRMGSREKGVHGDARSSD